jgi:hypothetical protein
MTTWYRRAPFLPCSAAASRRRAGTRLAGAVIGFALTLGIGGGGTLQAADLPGSFRGSAFATFANAAAGPVAAQLGRSAYQPCPCRGTNGQVLSNTVNSLQAGENGKVLKADATLSTVFTEKTATTARIQDTSTITGLNLFNGLITATTIKAVANVTATASTMSANPDGSTFVNLRINGNLINADVGANTVISLPGLGQVTLKKVTRSGNFTSLGRIVVQMLTVDVSQSNSFGLPVGVRITIAYANSAFSRTQPAAVVSGQAYATLATAQIGNSLQNRIGKAAFVVMGCEGTNGQTLTNNISSFSVGSLLALGNSVSTAFGGPQNGGTVARTTSTIENASLLGGLITATTIKAVAQETFKNGTRTRSTTGSGFVALRIGSLVVPINTPPNTELPLVGLGRVIINEQIIPISGGRTQVNGLHIFITTSNLLGLAVGSEIIIAHADAAATRF